MRCALGPKRIRKVERLTGRAVHTAYVRGGWEHHVAQVLFRDGSVVWVNYKTGEAQPDASYTVPWWGSTPPPEGCEVTI